MRRETFVRSAPGGATPGSDSVHSDSVHRGGRPGRGDTDTWADRGTRTAYPCGKPEVETGQAGVGAHPGMG